ncbi:hypothetical protein A2Z67_04745 [Candidatus Woesebacteria bacterium RBG_13_36_22]|uniref:Uncharacterized protein n=1 Tax=Candidatus Woesebacteria bacterium RBG_13_36_22 TaxID=1802478 RepID=A0A1F7X4C8_9BACT|nr:MAG: hypothetical protein A2Z67_04745 [Candidatus Woesebacteria bacterium RBG_13_36_22]
MRRKRWLKKRRNDPKPFCFEFNSEPLLTKDLQPPPEPTEDEKLLKAIVDGLPGIDWYGF